jgi:hypothetical protein
MPLDKTADNLIGVLLLLFPGFFEFLSSGFILGLPCSLSNINFGNPLSSIYISIQTVSFLLEFPMKPIVLATGVVQNLSINFIILWPSF